MLNNIYSVLKPILYRLDPELSHNLTLIALQLYAKICGARAIPQKNSVKIMGLNFANPIGLAAGLDKNGAYIDALAQLGFGFIEIGTVTPKAQVGNPKPRLFRFVKEQAIINCMGFNNHGIDNLITNIKKAKYDGILGINIGKNSSTAIEQAEQDYLFCLEKVYPYADYIVCNISSPNTAALRELQSDKYFINLFGALKNKQKILQQRYNKYVPLVVKIAPDLTSEEIIALAKNIQHCEIDGVIATNTTIDKKDHYQQYQGGLSGRPLLAKSNAVLKILTDHLAKEIPIIGVGGIMSAADAQEKFDLGASLVQVYSGLIFQGPGLVDEILRLG